MSADLLASEQNGHTNNPTTTQPHDAASDDEEDAEEEEEEPKLKYAKLTGNLTNIYRNGDSTSTFTVAGDKMVLGTHNGNVHVLQLPELKSLRTYHAHSATITSISVSPTPGPPSLRPKKTTTSSSSNDAASTRSPAPSIRTATQPTTNNSPRRTQPQQATPGLPNTPSNAIHIATSSLDGHICITSLLDPKDVQLRNFARPLTSVALSPDYRNDRTFLSGGRAGQLILTIGGKAGVTVDANTNSFSASTGGWLGAIGLGGDRGTDKVLHEGEGAISDIKWSLSGKWVVWVNEEGIKICRSHLKLGSEESEDAWRRIAHAARPNRAGWEEMVGVWRAQCRWVDERHVEDDEVQGNGEANGTVTPASAKQKKAEKLLVGWGDTVWILHVTEGSTVKSSTTTSHSMAPVSTKKTIGTADIIHKLQFRDCLVSGLALYTPSLLAILAYRTLDDDDEPINQPDSAGKKTGRQRHRHTGLAPQLRLVHVQTGEEEEIDELSISRFETLSAQDYWLGTLFIPPEKTAPKAAEEKGALEGLWDVAGGKYASQMFSGGASILTRSSDGKEEKVVASPGSSVKGVAAAPTAVAKKKKQQLEDAHPFAASSGLKLFIQSPYDCVLAVRRDLKDHLSFTLKTQRYAEAWDVVDAHPELVDGFSSIDDEGGVGSPTGQGSLADFFADERGSTNGVGAVSSAAEKEKRRIGELWLQQLVSTDRWEDAGRVAGKVLSSSGGGRWEHWVLVFAQAGRFDEVTPFIPPTNKATADVEGVIGIPSLVYEVVLGHYISADAGRLKELLDRWEPELGLYDTQSICAAVESRIDGDEVAEETEEWRDLLESLAKLYLADGRAREALKCYIRVQNADAAFRLIREEKDRLADVVAAEDVAGLFLLRVSKESMRSMPLSELEESSREAVALLVDEALRGAMMPGTVIRELEERGRQFKPFIFFYLRALWHSRDGDSTEDRRKRIWSQKQFLREEGHALVGDHADLAVELFAEYDRDLLMTFLRASELYSYEKASTLCETRHYVPELVYVLAKTGQTKRALFLIIGELGDVKQAITFVKENPDLWDDLLEYSMDKPAFIKGLLEEVGTAIDPVQLVRRIPEGLEIEGLRGGVQKMMRECDVQFSISEGVARVLRGEVSTNMDVLRAGQKKGVRFQVVHGSRQDIDLKVVDPPTKIANEQTPATKAAKGKLPKKDEKSKAGHCVGCGDGFREDEQEILIGFACGHVYHLSCLLKANPETKDPSTIQRLESQLGSRSTDDDAGYAGRSVGAKVAHAHIIRSVIKSGCQVCHTGS